VVRVLVWKRKVSRYVKRGKHGQVWDYYKMGVPRELATREVFVTKWGNGFLAMPSIEDVREYAFAGFWDGNRLFLPSSEPSRDYMICVGKAGPYNIYNIDKFSLWRSKATAEEIIKDLRSIADGIPSRVLNQIVEVKRKQGKVIIQRRDKGIFIKLTDEEIREEIEKILKGLWLNKKTGKLKRNKQFTVMLRLLKHNYLPVFEEKVKELEDLPKFSFNATLRPYQKKTLEEFLQRGRMTVVHPHGAGKTITAIAIMQKIRGRTLIVTELTNIPQWYDKIVKFTTLPKRYIGILGGGKYEVAPVTITTFGSFHKVAHRFWSLIIVDECHRMPATTFAPLSTIPCDYFLGLSGSPYREKKGETEMIYALAGPPDSQGHVWTDFYGKWVWKPTVYVLRVPFQSRFYKDKYEEADGREKFVIAGSNPIKFKYLQHYLAKYRKVVIFCRWLKQARRLAKKLGVPLLDGSSSLRQRRAICEWMRREDKAVAVFTEAGVQGTDIPSLECVITLSGNWGSRRESLQMAGRVMRMAEGKKCAVFIYIVTKDSVEEEFLKKRLSVLEEKGMPVVYID